MSDTPHDHLVQHVLARPEHARGEIETVLPAAIAARFDWSSLERIPRSYVDEALREQEANLVFRVRLHDGRPAFVYVLI